MHVPEIHVRAAAPVAPVVPEGAVARQVRGQRAVLSGQSAEHCVERAYLRRGCTCLARRWRGSRGEIDLVFRRGDLLVFVEVKSSSSFERAIESLHHRQLTRIQTTALEFLDAHSDVSHLDMRVDLAAVDGAGRFRVVPNITM